MNLHKIYIWFTCVLYILFGDFLSDSNEFHANFIQLWCATQQHSGSTHFNMGPRGKKKSSSRIWILKCMERNSRPSEVCHLFKMQIFCFSKHKTDGICKNYGGHLSHFRFGIMESNSNWLFFFLNLNFVKGPTQTLEIFLCIN